MGEPQLVVGDGMIVDDDRRQTGPLVTIAQSNPSELRRTGPFPGRDPASIQRGGLPPKSASEIEVELQPKEGRASSLGGFWGGEATLALSAG